MRTLDSQLKSMAPPKPISSAIVIANVDRNITILRPPARLWLNAYAIATGKIRPRTKPNPTIAIHMARSASVVGVEEDGHDAAQQQQPSGRGDPEGPEQPLEEPAHVAAAHRIPDQRDDDRGR